MWPFVAGQGRAPKWPKKIMTLIYRPIWYQTDTVLKTLPCFFLHRECLITYYIHFLAMNTQFGCIIQITIHILKTVHYIWRTQVYVQTDSSPGANNIIVDLGHISRASFTVGNKYKCSPWCISQSASHRTIRTNRWELHKQWGTKCNLPSQSIRGCGCSLIRGIKDTEQSQNHRVYGQNMKTKTKTNCLSASPLQWGYLWGCLWGCLRREWIFQPPWEWTLLGERLWDIRTQQTHKRLDGQQTTRQG